MRLFILITILCFANILTSQNDNELARNLRAKNSISEMWTYEYNLKSGDSLVIDHNFYNTHGNLIKDLRYDENGEIKFKFLLEYNEYSLMSKQIGYNEKDSISTILVYEYDTSGNRTLYKQIRPDGKVLNHQKRIYNELNQNTELYNKLKKFNKFYLSSKYYYTEDDLFSKIERFNPNGQLTSWSEYKYDKKNNLIAIYHNDSEGRELSFKSKYNRLNQETTRTFPKQKFRRVVNGKIETTLASKKIEYDYDSEGNIIEERTFVNRKLVSKKKFFYKKFST